MDDLMFLEACLRDACDAIWLELLEEEERNEVEGPPIDGPFSLDEISDSDCWKFFRFHKEHLPVLCNALGLTEFVTKQRGRVSALEGLCILLRRLAYPSRLTEIAALFRRHISSVSVIANQVTGYLSRKFGALLQEIGTNRWLTEDRMQTYAQAIHKKGAPLDSCWGFIDGTEQRICRPTVNQKEYFSADTHRHALKYQGVMCPDGIMVHIDGPYSGRKQDSSIFKLSGLYEQLEKHTKCRMKNYILFGDSAYSPQELLFCPYQSNDGLTPLQEDFNAKMSLVHQSVEWGFRKVDGTFAFLDFHQNQKMLLQHLGEMYKVGVLLANCHTILYGSQTTSYFNLKPPTLSEYLDVSM